MPWGFSIHSSVDSHDILYGMKKIIRKIARKLRGFTLIEILLVVAAIAILAGIVIIAINPAKQLGSARDAGRKSDVNTILNAIAQYSIDNQGTLPPTLTTTPKEGCVTGSVSCAGLLDLSVLTASSKYLGALPRETGATTTNGIGYVISKTVNSRIQVSASFPEQTATITGMR